MDETIEFAVDTDDLALTELVVATEGPLSEGVRERIRTFARTHFGAGEDGAESLPEPGTVLGRYRLERILGVGGQATVFRARDTEHPDRVVAIKVPHPDRAERMMGEAHVLSRLTHRGIVGLIDRGQDADTPYLVLDHMAGGSLQDLVEAEGPLAEVRVHVIAEEILKALAYAHEQGVVHRDLKPENVLFDDAGRAHIADFGIGKLTEEALSLSLTRGLATGVVGTPAYMAPEQERPGADVCARADVYAFGKLLYFMLTGLRPTTLKPVTEENPAVEDYWDDVVFRLTKTDPAERCSTDEAVRWFCAETEPPGLVLDTLGLWSLLSVTIVVSLAVIAAVFGPERFDELRRIFSGLGSFLITALITALIMFAGWGLWAVINRRLWPAVTEEANS